MKLFRSKNLEYMLDWEIPYPYFNQDCYPDYEWQDNIRWFLSLGITDYKYLQKLGLNEPPIVDTWLTVCGIGFGVRREIHNKPILISRWWKFGRFIGNHWPELFKKRDHSQ